MPNVLTDLAADLYRAADTVAREHVGFIPSVTINGGSERAAVGDDVRSAFTRATTAINRNQSMTISEGTDQTVDNKKLTITKDRAVEIPWTGEEIKHVQNGAGFNTIYGDQITQGIRTLTNEMETDLAVAAYKGASRATGTAGTTPFSADLAPLGNLEQLFIDNGAPVNSGQRSLVLNSATKASMYSLTQLTDVNRRDDNGSFLEQGIMGKLNSFNLRTTGANTAVIKGTGAAYETAAAYVVGDTAITVSTGTGEILAGDVITFAGDANKYVVATALTGGVVTIAAPGLMKDLANDVDLTIGGNYRANVAFERSGIELAVRAPAIPMINGKPFDAATDRLTIIDPTSGIPFDVAAYPGQGKLMIQISAVWGVRTWKSEFVNALLG